MSSSSVFVFPTRGGAEGTAEETECGVPGNARTATSCTLLEARVLTTWWKRE